MRQYDEVTFEIVEHIGVVTEREGGWNKEVNLVAWNGGVPKIDIRDWDAEHERMTRGITLYESEANELFGSYFNWRKENSVKTAKEKMFSKSGGDPTEVSVEVHEVIRGIGKRDGWAKEINIVTWNGGETKVDIRDWDMAHERMSRGITLFENEADLVAELIVERFKGVE